MMQNRVSAQNIVFGNLDKNGAPKDAYASILLQKKIMMPIFPPRAANAAQPPC
jgi:hypothetical protein